MGKGMSKLEPAASRKATTIPVDWALWTKCRTASPSRSSRVSIDRFNALLTEWAAAFQHPLVDELLAVATAMIQNRYISPHDSILVMKRIAPIQISFVRFRLLTLRAMTSPVKSNLSIRQSLMLGPWRDRERPATDIQYLCR